MKFQNKNSADPLLEVSGSASQSAPYILITDSAGNYVLSIEPDGGSRSIKLKYYVEGKEREMNFSKFDCRYDKDIVQIFVASIMAMCGLTPEFRKKIDGETNIRISNVLKDALDVLREHRTTLDNDFK